MLTIGLIISSNGSVFQELYSLTKKFQMNVKFIVVVDRECGAKEFCARNDIECTILDEKTNEAFSIKARDYFYLKKVQFILLFFSRLITKELFENFSIFNIHPSLLPLHKGMGAVKKSYKAKDLFLGCTLHLVNENMDDGKILIQTLRSVDDGQSIDNRNKISFLQKTLVGMILLDYLHHSKYVLTDDGFRFIDTRRSVNTNPCFLTDYIENSFRNVEIREKTRVLSE